MFFQFCCCLFFCHIFLSMFFSYALLLRELFFLSLSLSHFMFLNKTVHEQVSAFNNVLFNILPNYIPHKCIKIDDRDIPWMTKRIKDKINLKSTLYKSKTFIKLQNLSTEISDMISIRKEKYYVNRSKKLNNPSTRSKTHWSVLKYFYKGNKVT